MDLRLRYDIFQCATVGCKNYETGTVRMERASKISPVARIKGAAVVNDDHTVSDFTLYHFSTARSRRYAKAHHSPAQMAPLQKADPYLWVLLADHEIKAERLDQAEALIEAAYAAYDQCRFGS